MIYFELTQHDLIESVGKFYLMRIWYSYIIPKACHQNYSNNKQ